MNRINDGRPVVAATDFSHDGNAAVAYAADHAARLGRPLLIVHAAGVPTPTGPTIVSGRTIRRRLDRARFGAADLIGAVTWDHPGLTVTAAVTTGDPVDTLIDRTRDAFALVIGARGLGGHPALRWGSVSNRIVSRATCPVIVVRAGAHGRAPRAGGPIVVAGGTPVGEAATDFATALLRPGPTYVLTVHPGHGGLASGDLPVERMVIRVAAAPAVLVPATARVAAEYGAGLVVIARDRHPWPFRFGAGSAVGELVETLDCPLAIVDTTQPVRQAQPHRRPAVATAPA